MVYLYRHFKSLNAYRARVSPLISMAVPRSNRPRVFVRIFLILITRASAGLTFKPSHKN